MVGREEIAAGMVDVLNRVGGDPAQFDRAMNEALAFHGFDPEAARWFGNQIVIMAVEAEEEPEPTIVGAFCTGILLGAMLSQRTGGGVVLP